MRKYILLLIVCVFSHTADAVSIPASPAVTVPVAVPPAKTDPSQLKVRDIEQLLGRRLTLKEKIGWMLVKRQFKKNRVARDDFDVNKKARSAKTFGILSLVSLIIPFAGLLSLPFAIVAIVMGSQVRRVDPKNRDAKTAITLGIVTIGIFVLTILIVLAVLSAFTFA